MTKAKRIRIPCAGAYWRGWNFTTRHSDRNNGRARRAEDLGQYARSLIFSELIDHGETGWTSSRKWPDIAHVKDLSQAPERVREFFLTRRMKKRDIDKLEPVLLSEKQVRKLIGMTPAAARLFDDAFPPPVNIYTTLNRWRRTDVEKWLVRCGKTGRF